MAYNPRFPYSFKVIRSVFNTNGEPTFDDNGEPVYQTLEYSVAEYDNNMPVRGEGGQPVTVTTSVIPFGYRQQGSGSSLFGDAVRAEMKIACPLIIGEIKTKDLLELTDDDRTFRAEVVRKSNTNFGTNIWYNEVRQ